MKQNMTVYKGQNLSGQTFANQNLAGYDFTHADLRSTRFIQCDLSGTDFSGATFGVRNFWAALKQITAFIVCTVLSIWGLLWNTALCDLMQTGIEGNQLLGFIGIIVAMLLLSVFVRSGYRYGATVVIVTSLIAGLMVLIGTIAALNTVATAGFIVAAGAAAALFAVVAASTILTIFEGTNVGIIAFVIVIAIVIGISGERYIASVLYGIGLQFAWFGAVRGKMEEREGTLAADAMTQSWWQSLQNSRFIECDLTDAKLEAHNTTFVAADAPVILQKRRAKKAHTV